MSQEKILIFLKEHPNEWFCSKQIAEGMDVNLHQIHINLKKLRKGDQVISKINKKRKANMNRWMYKNNEI